MGFLDGLGDTLKSIGGAVYAPVGLAVDLATTPFDDKDDDFGSILRKSAKRATDVVDPLTNDSTWTGAGLGKVMQGWSWAYEHAIDQPLGTAATVVGHANLTHDYGSLFNGEDWAKAYEVSKERSLGQAIGLNQMALVGQIGKAAGVDNPKADQGFLQDPLNPKAWDNTKKATGAGWLLDTASIGTDLAVAWYLDPAVLAGKAAGVARASHLGKVKAAERPAFGGLLDRSVTGIRPKDWGGRVDHYFDFIQGDNHLKRPLNADEIWESSPELKRTSAGKTIAGLMDDALKLPTHEEQRNALRRIVAVSVGDTSQIARLRAESSSTGAIADALDNLAGGTTVQLARQALRDDARFDPELSANFDRQIGNLDQDGKVTSFVNSWRQKLTDEESSLSRFSDIGGEMDFVPGAHAGGERALKRLNSERLISDKALGTPDLMIQKARDYAHRDSYSTVWQSGTHHVPLVLAHSLGLAALPYKGTAAFLDALRTRHFTGVAKLDDWNGSVDQLDAMLRHAEVPDNVRHAALTRAYKAGSETEKTAAIEHAEGVSMQGIADFIGTKHGLSVDTDWVKATLLDGQRNRGMALGRMQGGRIYATSPAPAEVAARSRNYAKAQLQARADTAAGEGRAGIVPEERLAEIDDTPLRADQILDENGLPLALPLTVSQLGNRLPLLDVQRVKHLASDQGWADRFTRYGNAWKAERRELDGLMYRLQSTKVAGTQALQRAVRAKRVSLDALQDAGSSLTRAWKFGVLFRLGYPVRILMDDHMRISTQVGYSTFVFGNGSEGASNAWYNSRLNFRDGRYQQAATAYKSDQAQRAAILHDHFGLDEAPSPQQWDDFKKALIDPEADGAESIISRLDPQGKVREHLDRVGEARSLASAVTGHRRAITKWKQQIEEAQTKHSLGIAHGVDIPALRGKIHAAEAEIVNKDAGRAATLAQLDADAPDALMERVWGLDERLLAGRKAYLGDKVALGERKGVKVDDDVELAPAYAGAGAGYKNAASSEEHNQALIDTLEGGNLRLASSGAHRTVQPSDPGYNYIYAQVLNHQFQHSPELMSFVRGGVETPKDFAKWLAKPEQAYVRNRVRHYAHDPEGWGARLQQVYQDYLPTPALRRAVAKGRVSAKDIDRMVPEAHRPAVHTDLADVNSGRHTAVRMMSNGMNRAMGWLATTPTDRLSRHPFFNTMYRQHARELYNTRKAGLAEDAKLSSTDLADIERHARRKALNDVKRTLWDISAHSHAAHALRFLSPFFAAHQEALTRWWRIATDDPSVVRKFQLAFDTPRKAGLVYNYETGELVPEGEAPSPKHRIMLRLPGAESSAANRWLKKLGGDHFWSVNENGFNLILQNGIANPGAGPLVTVPMESLLDRYGSPELEKVARVLNPYPPDSPSQGFFPAWYKRMQAIRQGPDNAEFRSRLADNWADGLTQFRLDHDGAVPTEKQHDDLMRKATSETYADLWVMMASNAGSPLPAKPESKYTVVQHGLSKIFSQMRAGGHDYQWAQDQFKARYGEMFSAMLASQGTNPGKLDMSFGEVNAIRRYKNILSQTDPSMVRMVVGPAAAMDAKADPALGRYDQTAQAILRRMRVSPTSDKTYLGAKTPDELTVKTIADAGWTQYEELTNYLTLQAKQQGLKSYEDNPKLVDAKRAAVAYLREHNFAFRQDWDSYSSGDYEAKLDDMRQIATYKPLLKDPTRTDIYWLGQYLKLRDTVTATLKQRKSAGGHSTIDAQSNSDLAKAFTAGVQYIRDQSPFWDDYTYHGVVEHDPYLLAAGGE